MAKEKTFDTFASVLTFARGILLFFVLVGRVEHTWWPPPDGFDYFLSRMHGSEGESALKIELFRKNDVVSMRISEFNAVCWASKRNWKRFSRV